MLLYRTGTRGPLSGGLAMARHLSEPTLSLEQAQAAAYYAGDGRPIAAGTVPTLRRDADPRFRGILGIDPSRPPTEAELARVLAGSRTDGQAVAGKAVQKKSGAAPIAYVDFLWNPDKSVSIAWRFAETDAARAMILATHREAVAAAMQVVEKQVGRARKGHGGRDGYDAGTIIWYEFLHYTSRPTVEVVRTDVMTGQEFNEVLDIKVPGDPQLHSHIIVPNLVLTQAGRLGGLYLQRLSGRVHELGAIYQAEIATRLRALGVRTDLDPKTGAARIAAVPSIIRDAFSKRTQGGLSAARTYAASQGLIWDDLTPERRIELAKFGTQGDPRSAKSDDLSDWEDWQRQAVRIGWKPPAFLDLDQAYDPPPEAERIARAANIAATLLSAPLRHRRAVDVSVVRVAAARGLVATGLESADDIDRIVEKLADVRHDPGSKRVAVIPGPGRSHDGEILQFTEVLTEDQEMEVASYLRNTASDQSLALSNLEIQQAATQIDIAFEKEGNQPLIRTLAALAQSGRTSFAMSEIDPWTTFSILFEAWGCREKSLYGVATTWQKVTNFVEAGVAPARALALNSFLARAERAHIPLDDKTVIVIDEFGLLSTQDLLALLRLQQRDQFQIAAMSEGGQCMLRDARPLVDLIRKALGPEALPINQLTPERIERAQPAATAFRDGSAKAILEQMQTEGTALLLGGPAEHAAATAAEVWLRARDALEPGHTVIVRTPTQEEARLVAKAIRGVRKRLGEISGPEVEVTATDPSGVPYKLRIASGDRLRLHKRTNARCEDGARGVFGVNGSLCTVIAVEVSGLKLKNSNNRIGLVAWDTLRDINKNVLLSYADVVSVDVTAVSSSDTQINVFLDGISTIDVHQFKILASRQQKKLMLLVADEPMRRAIQSKRLRRDDRPVQDTDVWAHIVAELERRGSPNLARVAMLEARAVEISAGRQFCLCLHRIKMHVVKRDLASKIKQRHLVTLLRTMVLLLENFVVQTHYILQLLADKQGQYDPYPRTIGFKDADDKQNTNGVPIKQFY